MTILELAVEVAASWSRWLPGSGCGDAVLNDSWPLGVRRAISKIFLFCCSPHPDRESGPGLAAGPGASQLPALAPVLNVMIGFTAYEAFAQYM